MKKYIITSALSLSVMFALHSCMKKTDLSGTYEPELTTSYRYSNVSLPQHLGGEVMESRFASELNDDVVTLGRVLFYDPRLSLNNTVSCGSCHKQNLAFADGKRFSPGFEGQITKRNSPSIINPLYSTNLFWDSRVSTTEDLVLQPVQNHIEMGMESLQMLEKKLAATSYYPALFQKAFGNTEISQSSIAIAMSQFLKSMVTNNSKYDQGKATNFSNFTPEEKLGYALFRSSKAKCASCHVEPNFTLSSPEFADFSTVDFSNSQVLMFDNFVNGFDPKGPDSLITLPVIDPIPGGGMGSPYGMTNNTVNIGLDKEYADNGFGHGQFRIPSLRNIELTAPFMHDGRFNTLEEVVNHYNKGVQAHTHLDAKFKDANGSPKGLGLTVVEEKALVAFLKTLTDKSLTTDPKYADPFRKK